MTNEAITIFYTDDDGDDREFFTEAAQGISNNLQVCTQSDGNELIDKLHNPPPSPSILFLDLNMPGKSGFEVLKEIREAEEIKDIPVIIFSTSDDVRAIETTKQLGANLYITKPTSYSSLKQIIRHSLSIDWKNFPSSSDQFVYRVN